MMPGSQFNCCGNCRSGTSAPLGHHLGGYLLGMDNIPLVGWQLMLLSLEVIYAYDIGISGCAYHAHLVGYHLDIIKISSGWIMPKFSLVFSRAFENDMTNRYLMGDVARPRSPIRKGNGHMGSTPFPTPNIIVPLMRRV